MPVIVERPTWTYALWATVGVLTGFGVVGIMTIGIFVLGIAFILAIVGLSLQPSRSLAALAAIPGLGLMPLAVGLNNLGGPGERCSSTASSLSCSELLSPWPFLIPGILLIAVGSFLVWQVTRQPQS